MVPRSTFLVILASLAGLIYGTSIARADSASDVASIQWIDCATNVPSTLLQDPTFQLPSTLPSTLRCGRLDVPMDYSSPIGPSNVITLGFSMFRPQNPKGLLNFNPGGPGGETSSLAWSIALNLTAAPHFAGLLSYDFLAMDVRGSFSSNPLNCSSDLIIPSSLPSTEAEYNAYVAIGTQTAKICDENSTPKGIINFVSTQQTVRDWNSLRVALGYETMNFLSHSYGTTGAAIYTNLFPDSVGNFVLDGIAPLGISNLGYVSAQISDINRLILRADAFCLNDTTCPFHDQGKGSVPKAWSQVLTNAAAGAFPNISADDIRATTALNFLAHSPDFPTFNEGLFAASNGDASAFSYEQFGPLYSVGLLGVLALACADYHIDNATFAGWQAMRETLIADDPLNVTFSQVLGILPLCTGWPFHGNFNEGQITNAPMLLVTSDFDLNTPDETILIQVQESPNSVAVVRHGDDHGSYYIPGPARDAIVDFLVTGMLPQPVNETFVTIYGVGLQPGPVANPYSVPVGAAAGDGIDE